MEIPVNISFTTIFSFFQVFNYDFIIYTFYPYTNTVSDDVA